MDMALSSVDVLSRATPVASSASRMAPTRANFEKTASDFVSVFMAEMLKPMWDGVETDAMFGGGPGEDAMKDLLIQEYGKSVAATDRSGLTPAVMDAMLRMQEQANANA